MHIKESEGTLGRFISDAKQLRYRLQVKLGRPVSQGEIAQRIHVDRRVIMRIENNKFQELDRPVIERLADLYHQEGFDASKILYYIPDEGEEDEKIMATSDLVGTF